MTLDKSEKSQGVREGKYDFEMSIPLCRICNTIMVHFKGVPIIKSYSSIMTPLYFALLFKITIIVLNLRQFCIDIL